VAGARLSTGRFAEECLVLDTEPSVDAKIHAEEKTAAIVMAIDLRNVIRL
jgi:hypothetical protein